MSTQLTCKSTAVAKLFHCDVCNKDFNKKSNFKRHLLIHSPTPVVRIPRPCTQCSFNASTAYSLQQHIKRIHKKEFNHICSLCNQGYVLVSELQRHIRNLHPSEYEMDKPEDTVKKEDTDSKYSPLLKVVLSEPIVMTESKEEAPESPPASKPKYQCQHCEKDFIMKCNLTRHLLTHSKDYVEKTHVCPHCQFKACSSSSMHVHIRRIHTKDFKHVCSYCNKGFVIPNELRKHIETRHSFKETDATIDVIKNREEGSMCEVCNRLLTSQSEVEEHRKRHHNMLTEKKHRCSLCDYSTNYKGGLKRHLRYHLGDRQFQCEFCDKAFVETGALKIHLRTHTGESPYVCPTCGRRFKRHSNLLEHERTHSGEKPYLCDICSRRFTSRTGFSLHKCRQQSEVGLKSDDFLFL